jgi:glycosyltransferase involved in cell wall biosynthesis
VTGRLVAPGDVEALQEAMASLFHNPEELHGYACAIKREKKDGKISWNRITDAYVSLYSEKLEQL